MIATDERVTYILFNYPVDGRLQWIGRPGQDPAVVGYAASDLSTFDNHLLSGTASVLSVTSSSNIDVIGRYLYRVSLAGNRCASRGACLDWYSQDIAQYGRFPFWHLFVQPCPCTLFQAFTDFRFIQTSSADDQSTDRLCFVSLFGSFDGQQAECCYRSDISSPFISFFSDMIGGGSLITQLPFAGSANRFHSFFSPTRHREFDVQPYQRCCFDSDLCNLYFERRPSPPTCTERFPLFFFSTWGDPHFTTLDGNEYTFNGLGEYLIFKSADDRFEFQGRTRLVTNSSATEFSAFVSRQISVNSTGPENSTIVQVSLVSASEVRLMVCCYGANASLTESLGYFDGSSWRDVSKLFSDLAANGVLILDNVIVSRGEANDSISLVVSFSSDITVTITARSGLLSFVMGLPDEYRGNTRGLVGQWDGNRKNDFIARSGKEISLNASSRTIHNDFGQTCESQKLSSAQ